MNQLSTLFYFRKLEKVGNLFGPVNGHNIFCSCILFCQVIMFLSKSEEEISSNRKLAKELVDKWVSNAWLIWFAALYILPPLPSYIEC